MAAKIVIANWVHEEVIDLLGRYGIVVANPTREPWERAELLRRCSDADALIAFMPEMVDRAFLDACSKLGILACALKGYDNFDIDACSERGVLVTIVPDLLTVPTAELSVGLMIALARNVRSASELVHTGQFQGWRPNFYGKSIHGSTVGLVGAGKVGKEIARQLSGFSCKLNYWDQNRLSAEEEATLGLTFVDPLKLRGASDFIVLALPLTPSTKHFVDGEFLSSMKSGSFLVNPARGSLVDETAVIDALESGHLAGYAADTFEFEDWARPDRPVRIDGRLLESRKTLFTPHIGSAVDVVRRDIAMAAATSVVQFLSGDSPSGAVNDHKLGLAVK